MSFPKRAHDALNYNEQKVQRGVAQRLHAAGYLRTADDLSVSQKLEGLQLRNSLNKRALSKTLHVSLNFSPQDRAPSRETLRSIARDYMEEIAFFAQPYMVHRHHYAGHLHMACTIIRMDGTCILSSKKRSKVQVPMERT